tara:strand:+ start:48 stop:497 length:450 start_codon:yes stop_codon:yes gene_type:complete
MATHECESKTAGACLANISHVSHFFSFFSYSWYTVQAAAADALANLAIDNAVGETLLNTRKSSVLFTMATHESDVKVSKTAGACLANITSLHYINKHKVVTTGISFLQRINGAAVKSIVRRRLPDIEDLDSGGGGSTLGNNSDSKKDVW